MRSSLRWKTLLCLACTSSVLILAGPPARGAGSAASVPLYSLKLPKGQTAFVFPNGLAQVFS
ncbi:MAG TPA: hypothetical protein VEJ20_01845, partial [Candidatus Eremiobacteraceae bacterium]|nr:hypothetical protein [Candidatus Eremiobacteraceae bacterium]